MDQERQGQEERTIIPLKSETLCHCKRTNNFQKKRDGRTREQVYVKKSCFSQ